MKFLDGKECVIIVYYINLTLEKVDKISLNVNNNICSNDIKTIGIKTNNDI